MKQKIQQTVLCNAGNNSKTMYYTY